MKALNSRRKTKYDRDVQEASDDDKDDGEYQSGDFIRGNVRTDNRPHPSILFSACVSHVDPHKEDLQLTIEQSSSRTSLSSLSKERHSLFSFRTLSIDEKAGRIPPSLRLTGSEMWPFFFFRVWSIKTIYRHISRSWSICDMIVVMSSLSPFSLLRRQEEEPLSYEDILQTSKSFSNRACVQTLYQRLKQSFQQIQPEQQQHSESSATPSSTNDILHMTLINAFKRYSRLPFLIWPSRRNLSRKQIPPSEYFDKLRQKQDREWAMERSVFTSVCRCHDSLLSVSAWPKAFDWWKMIEPVQRSFISTKPWAQMRPVSMLWSLAVLCQPIKVISNVPCKTSKRPCRSIVTIPMLRNIYTMSYWISPKSKALSHRDKRVSTTRKIPF